MSSAIVINSLEFAQTAQELCGTVSVAQLARLADSLFDVEGTLNYQLLGERDEQQRPRLNLRVEGEINLRCQRCLGRLPFPVAVEARLLVLTGAQENAVAELDDLDGIPADPRTEVWSLVEDEVLLAMPFAARHPEGMCNTALDAHAERAASPFEVLSQLKRNRTQN